MMLLKGISGTEKGVKVSKPLFDPFQPDIVLGTTRF